MIELFRRLRALLSNRIVILAILFAVILYFLWSNLFRLQVLEPGSYDDLSADTYVRTVMTDGTRGDIYDRYGRP